ncbi:MAG: tRNA (guanosine(37)-N1)-methyltransferase TrmD [Acidobacteriota bacterium]|nr:tRNA (guanosine(37)-N1)-methyltransferase TrmD [Acidobacteriota bacterium]
MRVEVISIFPEMFRSFLQTSLVGNAVEEGLLNVGLHDLRDYTDDPHRSVDDEPYGGGGGMVMSALPWLRAVRTVSAGTSPWRVLLSPQGVSLGDAKVRELAAREHVLLLCGRYEGLDERVAESVVDEEISIGDYVMAGGEIPAMVLIEAISRMVPGVVGLADSVENDSFRHGILDYPHYTRPREVEGVPVPEVLVSGNHQAIADWRRERALEATRQKRPDLLESDGRRSGGADICCKSAEETA